MYFINSHDDKMWLESKKATITNGVPATEGVACWVFEFFKQVFFKLIYLIRSTAKQVIPTYINHSQPVIPDRIHLFVLNEV